MRAEQVGVQREEIAVPDGDVQHRLDAHPRLDEACRRERAHAPLRPRRVRDVDGVRVPERGAQLLHCLAELEPDGGRNLHRDGELAARDALCKPRRRRRRGVGAARLLRRPLRNPGRDSGTRARRPHAPQRVARRRDVLRRRAAAAPDRRRARADDLPHRLAEVLRRRRVLKPSAHVGGQAGVGLNDERRAGQRRHALDDASQEVGADAAVRARREQPLPVERGGGVLRRVAAARQPLARERQLRDHGQAANGADGVQREAQLRDGRERLEQDEVGAGVGERVGLLRERVALLARAEEPCVGLATQRPHRAGDPDALPMQPRRLPRQGDAGAVQLFDAPGHPMRAQARRVRAERVGFDEFRARPQIAQVHGADGVGSRDVRRLERRVGHSASVELRAGRAVAEQRPARQTLFEGNRHSRHSSSRSLHNLTVIPARADGNPGGAKRRSSPT